MGITFFSYSNVAILIGSIKPFGSLINIGAPIVTCNARAPIMRAFSKRVYFKFNLRLICYYEHKFLFESNILN